MLYNNVCIDFRYKQECSMDAISLDGKILKLRLAMVLDMCL